MNDDRTFLRTLDACPSCGSADCEPFYASTHASVRSFEQVIFAALELPWRPARYDLCHRCGLSFLNPRWNSAGLGKLYGPANLYRRAAWSLFLETHPGADELDYFRHIDATVGRDGANHHHLQRARFIRRNGGRQLPARALVADVGAGFGGAQRAIEQAGFSYRGFESSPEMVARAATWGRTLENVAFDAAPGVLAGTADVVYTAQFLEHIDEPVKCLLQLRDCLRDGGLMFVDVPTCHYTPLDDGWFSTGGIRRCAMNWGHMSLFDVDSLSNALLLAGYEPVAHQLSLGNLWMLGRRVARTPAGSLRPPAIDRLRTHVHVLDPALEPVANSVLAVRGKVRDLAGRVGLLSTYRALRQRVLEA